MKIKVLDENNDCLAEANCSVGYLKDFTYDYFVPELLQKEVDYFFLEEFNEDDKEKTKNVSLDYFIKYVNSKYEDTDTSTLNELYKSYIDLNNYLPNNKLDNREYVCLNSIQSNYDNTGAGTLIVDYLKENFKLIYLYATMEVEGYFLNKANFKQILNGFMYWTNDKKLNEIL